MATNYIKVIYDELKSIIKINWTRFADKDRIHIGNKINLASLGYEDSIWIKPLPSSTLTTLTTGKITKYQVNLVYFKKLYTDDALDTITQFAEDLEDYFTDNYIWHSGYWLNLIFDIDYELNISEYLEDTEDYEINGFEAILTFTKAKI